MRFQSLRLAILLEGDVKWLLVVEEKEGFLDGGGLVVDFCRHKYVQCSLIADAIHDLSTNSDSIDLFAAEFDAQSLDGVLGVDKCAHFQLHFECVWV